MKMKKNNTKFVGRWRAFAAVVIGAGLLNASPGFGQDTKTAPPATAAKSDAPATPATVEATKDAAKTAPAAAEKSAEKAEAPAKKATEPVPASPAAPAATAAPSKDAAPRTTAAARTEEKAASKETAMPGKTESSAATKAIQKLGVQEQVNSGWSPWVIGLVILALFVLPIMAGNYLAKIWRMPDHAWKMSLVIGAFAASILICLTGEIKKGPDLAGGITLIYELAEAPTVQPAQQGGGQTDASRIKSGAREFT